MEALPPVMPESAKKSKASYWLGGVVLAGGWITR
jgi:TolA-binding protein